MRQVLSNVKAIRSMSIQPVFDGTYGRVVASTYAGGIRAAPFAGLGFASTFTLTYLSQGAGGSSRWQRPEEGNGIVADSSSRATGIMLLVGAVLVTSGRYTFGKMLQVFSLIIFTVTFAGQLMNYCKLFKACTAFFQYDQRRLTFFCNQCRRWRSHFKRRMTCCVYSIFATKPTRHAGKQGLRYKDASTSATSSSAILRARPRRFCTASVSKSTLANAWPSSGAYPESLCMGTGSDSFSVCLTADRASGSGKSTVAALLQRLYEPTAGQVHLDGRPLSDLDVHHLRDHTAVVSQHPALFDMTIAENIAYGRDDASMADIRRAASAAHIDEFIEALPLGYDTKLGDNAALISGGQAQRLQMARALMRPRELLILDECTSALDPANQRLVMDTVMRVKEGRTTVVITHKLAVMEQCDRLLVMADGHVVET